MINDNNENDEKLITNLKKLSKGIIKLIQILSMKKIGKLFS